MCYNIRMTKKKNKRLTLKEQEFTDQYVESNGKGTQAALIAYDCDKTDAANIASQNLKKEHIQDAISAKLKEFKGQMLDKITQLDLMTKALDSANEDLMDEDPKVRWEARKFTLEVAKFLDLTNSKREGSKHVHFDIPKWRG
jgi:phage terminase small subunit